MTQSLKVALIGYGAVSRAFLDLAIRDPEVHISKILTRKPYTPLELFTQDISDIKDIDVIVEAITDTNVAKNILVDSNVKYYITCNKPMIRTMKNVKLNKTVYLTSIVSGQRGDKFEIPLTLDNIFNYSDEDLFCFRFGGATETAQDMYNDLLEIKKVIFNR
jgi:homospermidine synthase